MFELERRVFEESRMQQLEDENAAASGCERAPRVPGREVGLSHSRADERRDQLIGLGRVVCGWVCGRALLGRGCS